MDKGLKTTSKPSATNRATANKAAEGVAVSAALSGCRRRRGRPRGSGRASRLMEASGGIGTSGGKGRVNGAAGKDAAHDMYVSFHGWMSFFFL